MENASSSTGTTSEHQLLAIQSDILTLRERVAEQHRRSTNWGVVNILLTALLIPLLTIYLQYLQTTVQRATAIQQQAFAEAQTLQNVIPYVVGDSATAATRRAAIEIVKPMESPELMCKLAWILSDEGDHKHALKAVESALRMAKTKQSHFVESVQRVYTTVIANHAEAEFNDLRAKLRAKQITSENAISSFDAGMARMLHLCGDPRLGAAGKACVRDRVRGGDHDFYREYRDKMLKNITRSRSRQAP